MSLRILKAGILDSIQDTGRYGYRRFGINPTGAMDIESAKLANLIVGNDEGDAVIEMHFPASVYFFEKDAIIALCGADFSATIDHQPVRMNETLFVHQNSTLHFTYPTRGARCYLAVAGGFGLPLWLNSYSTHFKAGIGGYEGRRLLKDDQLHYKNNFINKDLFNHVSIQPSSKFLTGTEINILPGPEWDWISENDQDVLLNSEFVVSGNSDRMAYHLSGPEIHLSNREEMISSGVCFGTIQLLPDGHLIILMADHQTTGGYPRIGNVITAHHSILAQKRPGDRFTFRLVDIEEAERVRA